MGTDGYPCVAAAHKRYDSDVLEYRWGHVWVVIGLMMAAVVVNSVGLPLVRTADAPMTPHDLQILAVNVLLSLAAIVQIMSAIIRRA